MNIVTAAKPADLSVTDIARGVAAGTLSPVDVVATMLARIDAREPTLKAWAHLDADGALVEAEILAAEAKAGRLRGPLHGVPIGIKDVFHVAGMPTLANSRTTDRQARDADSGLVAALRAAGAIILGKCATVEFAGMGIPPETRNPWNPEHTAGGSSSGSGAAVGARMVPAAIGTQTGGSNLRPAAYCGIAGFKPSYGAYSRAGLWPVSWTLDHPGLIARAAGDLALLHGVVAKRGTAPHVPPKTWRIGLVRDYFLEKSDADTVAAVETAVARLAEAGASTSVVSLPALFRSYPSIHRLVMSAEMANFHAPRLAAQAEIMTPRHRHMVEAFALLPATYYMQALRARRVLRDQLATLFADVDILVMPTAPGPAPAGLASTGDASLLSPWSLVGFPAATVPCGLAGNGLPLGLQLVGAPGADETVLAAAIDAEAVLGRLNLPN